MAAAVFACMRNEGAFVLEWLAYHRVIGFDPVLVATNDCTDGSDLLLDRLAAAGVLIHLPHTPARHEAPQDSGMRAAFDWLDQHPVGWLLHIDSDEYLNLRPGCDLQDLLDMAGTAHVIALAWRMFGDSGHATWPGATLPYFTRCADGPDPAVVKYKSLFRPAAFGHATDHMPGRPRIAAPRVVAADGRPLDPAPLHSTRHHSRYQPAETGLAPGAAVINHYAIRSADTFRLRAARGDGQGKDGAKYRIGARWHRMANTNSAEDRSILRHWPATEAEMARLRTLPGVAEAEAACLADFNHRLKGLM